MDAVQCVAARRMSGPVRCSRDERPEGRTTSTRRHPHAPNTHHHQPVGPLRLTRGSFRASTRISGELHDARLPSNGTTLHVRIGGSGPAVVLLHGFGDTGDMWAPLAADLARDHTVIVPTCAAWDSRRDRPAATTR